MLENLNPFTGPLFEGTLISLAIIAEVIWYHSQRKELLKAQGSRERKSVERKYRRIQFQLQIIFVLLIVWYFIFGNPFYTAPDKKENQMEEQMLQMDSSERDEFMEQYLEERRNQEIDE